MLNLTRELPRPNRPWFRPLLRALPAVRPERGGHPGPPALRGVRGAPDVRAPPHRGLPDQPRQVRRAQVQQAARDSGGQVIGFVTLACCFPDGKDGELSQPHI